MFAKDAKELINDIKRRDYKVIHKKDYDLLLNYINQLEKNIDDAIGYIKYCQISDKDIFPIIEAEKMTEILKGGSNENSK